MSKTTNDRLDAEFWNAVAAGDIPTARELRARGADPNAKANGLAPFAHRDRTRTVRRGIVRDSDDRLDPVPL